MGGCNWCNGMSGVILLRFAPIGLLFAADAFMTGVNL